MYWRQKLSQKDIAKKFNINTVQVHRILNDAEKRGSVKVFVEGSFDICRQYEESLKKKYGTAAATGGSILVLKIQSAKKYLPLNLKKVRPKAVGREKIRETMVEHTVTIIEFIKYL